MKHLLLIFFTLFSISLFGQIKPHNFPVDNTPSDTDALYTQELVSGTSIARKFMLPVLKKYFSLDIRVAPIPYTPFATGNTEYLFQLVEDPEGDSYYIDGEGNSMLLYDAGVSGAIADSIGVVRDSLSDLRALIELLQETKADSLDVHQDSIVILFALGVEIASDTIHGTGGGGGGGVGKGYIIQDSAPADTLYKWVDRTTWDSTTVFHVKEYILGEGWVTTGYLDTINYAYSASPPIYVVITGQSNATPRSGQTATVSDTIASPMTTIWNGDSESWTPLHTGKQWMNGTFPGRSVWWGLTMGKEAATVDNRIVKIVYHASGGLTIDNWFTDSLHWDTLSQRIADSGIPRIDAGIWDQGETDGWTGRRPEQYQADWFRVMGQFQALPEWYEDTRIFAIQMNTGEIGNEFDLTGFPSGEMANTFFNRLADDNHKWTYVVKNDDTQVIADSSHINADANITLGKRLWGLISGRTIYNPIARFDSRRINGDSILLDFQFSAIAMRTEEGDTSLIKGYKNEIDGWTGFFRVINDNVNVIPPDAQMMCYSDAAELIEIDTIKGKYISPGYLRNDTLILSQCPIGGNFIEAVPVPLELGVFAWYDAAQEDLLYYNNGDEVTTLHDFSGNDIDLTNSGTPTLKSNAVNGKASIVFNSGNADYFTLTDTTFSFLHYDSSTVVVVFKPGSDAVPNPDSLYAVLATQEAFGSSQKGFSLFYDDRSAFLNVDKMGSYVSNGSALVVNGTFTSTAPANQFSYIYLETDPENGTAVDRSRTRTNNNAYNHGNSFSNTASVTTETPFNIGRSTHATNGFYLTGEVAEVMIFKQKILNTIELGKLRNYLNRKLSFNLEP